MLAFVYLPLYAVFEIGSYSSEAFLKIVCLGQLEINSLLPFLKIKMFSCLTISQYFHLCNCLLEIRTLEKQAKNKHEKPVFYCTFDVISVSLASSEQVGFFPKRLLALISYNRDFTFNPQTRTQRNLAKHSELSRSRPACLCEPWRQSQAEAASSSVPQVQRWADTAVAAALRSGCPRQLRACAAAPNHSKLGVIHMEASTWDAMWPEASWTPAAWFDFLCMEMHLN